MWYLIVSIPFLCILTYFVNVSVLCVFLTMPCVGLQCVIVEFPDHNHTTFLCFVYILTCEFCQFPASQFDIIIHRGCRVSIFYTNLSEVLRVYFHSVRMSVCF